MRKDVTSTALIVTGLVALYLVLQFDGASWIVAAVLGGVLLVALVPAARWWVQSILLAPRPVARAVAGLVVLGGVVVTGFAAAYYGLAVNGIDEFDGLETKADALTLAASKLATFGFRAITPESTPAKLLVASQLALDLVFVAATIGVLAWVVDRSRQVRSARA